jgi:hypothetical protein
MLKQGLRIRRILLRLGIKSIGNSWHFAQWLLWHIGQSPLGRRLAYRGHHSAICQQSAQTLPKVPQSANWMPSRSKICWISWISFHIDGCGTLRTVALRRPIFRQKKGSAAISLGLNFCSMGSSHSLSRDTVPLTVSVNKSETDYSN